MVILMAITVIPMLVVARYSHASADDFGWGAGARRQVWNETHSIMQFVKAAFQGTVSMYQRYILDGNQKIEHCYYDINRFLHF